MKKICYDKQNNLILLYHPYDPKFIEFVKQIKGCWWESILKVWSLPNQRTYLSRVSQISSKFDMELDLSLGDSVLCDLVLPEEELHKSPITVSDEVKQLMLEELKDIGCLRTPRNYQLAAIFQMLQWDSILLADDMGLGKTSESLVIVELLSLFPCLVICPASVKYNWRNEWHKWFGRRKIDIVDDDFNFMFTGDVLVTNYDRVIDRKVKGGTKKENSEFFKSIPWKSIICDESHYLKNNKSERSIAIKKISKNVIKKIFLSGTPTLNCPSELINPFEILGVLERVFGHWLRYIRRYCNGKKTAFGWDISGASNIEELNMIMRRTFYIRREKREVLHELPSIEHTIIEVDISNRKDYRQAELNLIDYIKRNISLVASQKAANAEQLVLLKTLRMLVGKGKVEPVIEFVENFLETTDRKLLIFGIHKDVLGEIVKKFHCMKIDGETDPKKRLSMVQYFTSSNERVMCGNIQSLGLGTDGLQDACSDMIVLELPDRPGDIDQTISRLERMGQKNAINVYFPIARNTIDNKLWSSLQSKKLVVDGVNKGIVEEISFNVMNDVLQSYLE